MFDLDARLSAPFDVTFSDVRGGIEVTFISGEQVVRRLNEVLGVSGWSFRILRHDISTEADEVWALGELVADVDGKLVTRQQFGSQKIKRSRSTGAPLDLGFDLKGASTDAMKKCASLLGVGLYLSRKEPSRASRGGQRVPVCVGRRRRRSGAWRAPYTAPVPGQMYDPAVQRAVLEKLAHWRQLPEGDLIGMLGPVERLRYRREALDDLEWDGLIVARSAGDERMVAITDAGEAWLSQHPSPDQAWSERSNGELGA